MRNYAAVLMVVQDSEAYVPYSWRYLCTRQHLPSVVDRLEKF